jgi:hypothetical protein
MKKNKTKPLAIEAYYCEINAQNSQWRCINVEYNGITNGGFEITRLSIDQLDELEANLIFALEQARKAMQPT